MQVEKPTQDGHVNQKTLQKPLANIKRTRFEHLQKQNFRKKAKCRLKTAHNGNKCNKKLSQQTACKYRTDTFLTFAETKLP